MAQSRIAICLYKDDVTSFEYAKFFSGHLQSVTLKHRTDDVYLFQRKSTERIPAWVDIVKKFSKVKDKDLSTASSGAILILKVKKRYFACCFGTSVSNVNRESIESDFGLGAVFKRMTRSHTKSIESFTFSSNPITSQRTSTIPTVRDNFNIDVLSENITELQGFFQDKLHRFLIKGKEFFSCPAVQSLDEIKKLCQQLLLDYQNAVREREYQKLTATRKVKNKAVITQLDKELCLQVIAKSANVYLTDYEQLGELSGYKIDDLTKVDELDITNCINLGKKKKPIDTDFLKSQRIIPLDSNDQELGSWSLYKTLFLEVDSGGKKYILYKGNWYEIDPSFLAGLKNFLDQFTEDFSSVFPSSKGLAEGMYNTKAAKAKGQLWDRKLYTHADYRYGIEFCDILTNDFIVSVKSYKSSALNSHLLLQTLVSAQLTESDLGILKWVDKISNSKFKGTNLLGTDLSKIKTNKTFLILLMSSSKKKPSEILPFFSLVSFKLILSKIQSLGFKVKVSTI